MGVFKVGRVCRPCALLTTVALIVSLAPRQAMSETPAPPTPSSRAASAVPLQQIVVQSSALSHAHLGGSLAVHLVGRVELDRFGNVPLSEALVRSGALTLVPGRHGAMELAIAGLGDGYTQILIDGAPAPRGFALDSLPVDTIERVEIFRAVSAELTARGIAGTVNVVLRRANRIEPGIIVKATGAAGWTRGHGLDTTVSKRNQVGSLLLQASTRRNIVERESFSDRRSGTSPNGERSLGYSRGFSLEDVQQVIPKVQLMVENHRIGIEGLVQRSRQRRFMAYHEDVVPASTLRVQIRRDAESLAVTHRVDQWLGHMEVESRIAFGRSDRTATARYDFFDLEANRLEDQGSVQRSFDARVKLKIVADAIGVVDIGGDHTRVGRREEQGVEGDVFPKQSSDVSNRTSGQFLRWRPLTAGGTRVELGARREVLVIAYRDTLGGDNSIRRQVLLAPSASIVQALGPNGAALSLTLTRSMRVPDESDFSHLVYLAAANDESRPDFTGNPLLRPERANSMDFAVSGKLPEDVEARMNVGYKRLVDVILRDTLRRDGRWISVPINLPEARLLSLALSLKGRTNLDQGRTVTWTSSLESVHARMRLKDGTVTALANTSPLRWTASMDLSSGGAWAFGGDIGVRLVAKRREPGGLEIRQEPARTLGLYTTWSPTTRMKLRVTGTQLLQKSTRKEYRLAAAEEFLDVRFTERERPTVRLHLEWSL